MHRSGHVICEEMLEDRPYSVVNERDWNEDVEVQGSQMTDKLIQLKN